MLDGADLLMVLGAWSLSSRQGFRGHSVRGLAVDIGNSAPAGAHRRAGR